ncbi:MAG: hypothetical protein LM590_03240 [Thermofilum sp.]|jgi:hypothetical protein|nr:hypothetical protein [Thermofilum sp.]
MHGLLPILDFDGVVTKLNIDGVEVHGEVSRAVGFRVDSLLYFWDKHVLVATVP